MERKPDRSWVSCPDCKTLTDTTWPIHICTIWKNGMRISSTKKHWNTGLSVWEIVPEETEEKRVFDQEQRELSWQKQVKAAENAAEVEKEQTEATYQSCEIPARTSPVHHKGCICDACKPSHLKTHIGTCRCYDCWKWKFDKGAVTETWLNWGRGVGTGSYYYHDVKPWAGVDAKKWPSTFKFLMGQYYISNRWYEGLTISSKDYENRVLRGVYAEEPKRYEYKKPVEKASEVREKELGIEEDEQDEFWRKWSMYGDA